jgi:stearoyl-CoA desaturase (delta-9 desaturase)
MLRSGFFDLSWWVLVLVALVLTHVTIVAVTVFLHRHQAHRALELHPIASHFFRFWLWLTTGMVTREWVAVHRKHHAKCETVDDPHSPQVHGIGRLLSRGVLLYVREANNYETVTRYGRGTPEDWIERHVYSRCPVAGAVVLAVIEVILFGLVPGMLLFGIQMAWIPFWAAGVINGLGHFWGYRNYPVDNASTNLLPWGILIGGEELHNNHHATPTSAKLSSAWYEFDIGWMYIRLLAALGLARALRTAPQPRVNPAKHECDAATVKAVIEHRYYVLARYTRSVQGVWRQRVAKARYRATSSVEPIDSPAARTLVRWFNMSSWDSRARHSLALAGVVSADAVLHTLYSMREELSALWAGSSASSEQLLLELRDWCHRAELTGIAPLQEFSRKLPQLV